MNIEQMKFAFLAFAILGFLHMFQIIPYKILILLEGFTLFGTSLWIGLTLSGRKELRIMGEVLLKGRLLQLFGTALVVSNTFLIILLLASAVSQILSK